jgi:hypothetical protein
MQKLVDKRIESLMNISPKQDIDLYYINLMNGLYDGANELLDFETNKGNNTGLLKQAGLFRQFHTERKTELSSFFKSGYRGTAIDSRFIEAAKAALSNFYKIHYGKYRDDNEMTTKILTAYYENMDQISVAFVSFSKNEKLKALSWDIIRKQNNLIELLSTFTYR